MENKACILKNTVVTLNMYLNLVFTKNVGKLSKFSLQGISPDFSDETKLQSYAPQCYVAICLS